jgi:ParB family chromosome partitioning protein
MQTPMVPTDRVQDDAAPQPGQIVRVRSRQYLVEEVVAPANKFREQTLVSLSCLDDDSQGVTLQVLWTETEEEAEARKAEYEQRSKEYEAEQQRKEEERKRESERQQREYEAEQSRREKLRKARLATFDRILANAPPTFTAPQLRVFLSALVNLDPYDFAEDVAAFYVADNENNQQTPEEVLSTTLAALPDEKLTAFALRLVLTAHAEIPRESDFDFLTHAEAVFVPPASKKAATTRKPQAVRADAKQKAKIEAPPKREVATKAA